MDDRHKPAREPQALKAHNETRRRAGDPFLQDTHDKVVRLEVWVAGIEKSLDQIRTQLAWLLGVLAMVGVGIVVAILSKSIG